MNSLRSTGSLTEEMISRSLREAPPSAELLELERDFSHFRPASVLIPLIWDDQQWHILLTRRTEAVNSHKGQVSFPGGASENGDGSPEATALREAWEEIGLEPRDVKLLGRLPARPTISNFLITPVVGAICWPYNFQLSLLEVSRVFTIPLAWLADPAHWQARPRAMPGGFSEHVIYFEPYDGELLWGISARIMLDFMSVLEGTA